MMVDFVLYSQVVEIKVQKVSHIEMHLRDKGSFRSQCYISARRITSKTQQGWKDQVSLTTGALGKVFSPSSTGVNSIHQSKKKKTKKASNQPCLWFPPKPLNLMHPPREIEFTVEPPFVAFPSLLPLSYPPDQRAL